MCHRKHLMRPDEHVARKLAARPPPDGAEHGQPLVGDLAVGQPGNFWRGPLQYAHRFKRARKWPALHSMPSQRTQFDSAICAELDYTRARCKTVKILWRTHVARFMCARMDALTDTERQEQHQANVEAWRRALTLLPQHVAVPHDFHRLGTGSDLNLISRDRRLWC